MVWAVVRLCYKSLRREVKNHRETVLKIVTNNRTVCIKFIYRSCLRQEKYIFNGQTRTRACYGPREIP